MLVVDGGLLSTVEEIEEPFASVQEVVAIASDASGHLPYDELLARGSDDARDSKRRRRSSGPRSRSTTPPAPLDGRKG